MSTNATAAAAQLPRNRDATKILRVSSAHGPRDSIQSLHHFVAGAGQNPPPPPPSYQQSQIQRNPAAINSGGGDMQIHPPAPPMYPPPQALTVSAPAAGFPNNRKSPEARAVQAVPPFGVRDVVIPDECQVVKQLVREVTSGQLVPPAVDSYLPPPAYDAVHNQQRPSQDSSGSSAAHPLLEPRDRPPSSPRMSLSHPDLTRLQAAPPSTTTKMHPLLAAQNQHSPLPPPNLETSVYEISNVPTPVVQRPHVLQSPGGGAAAATASSGEFHHQYHQVDVERGVTARMLNLLTEENKSLRSELEVYIKKAFKLQQLELQYQKIQREYEDLVRKCEKRESLESQMQNRMQLEFARINELNHQLTDQLESAMAQMTQYHIADAEDSELRHEITKRDMVLASYAAQNKELLACKQRQEIEMDAQRITLEEQRAHILILDKALSNAQEKSLKLEEELKKKCAYVQRCEQLQQTLHKYQETTQKREEGHRRAIANLQKEITQLQMAKKENQKSRPSTASSDVDELLATKLKRDLQERDEQIFAIQRESLQWQELYYDEVKRRETEIDEAADSKNAKIKVLQESSDKAEKRFEAAQYETKKYLDDLRSTKSRNSELESQNQVLEARLAERNALINVLRRRTQNSAVSGGGNGPPGSESGYGDNLNMNNSGLFSFAESYGLTDNSKKHLEAARRRLWLSPSPSRCFTSSTGSTSSKLYQRHNKFTSVDASFNLNPANSSGGGYGSLGRAAEHGRTQSSCDSSYLSSMYINGGPKEREIFTLPTRRSRTKIENADNSKLPRPRSADDHLLATTEVEKHQEDVESGDKSPNNEEKAQSSEQLWDV